MIECVTPFPFPLYEVFPNAPLRLKTSSEYRAKKLIRTRLEFHSRDIFQVPIPPIRQFHEKTLERKLRKSITSLESKCVNLERVNLHQRQLQQLERERNAELQASEYKSRIEAEQEIDRLRQILREVSIVSTNACLLIL